MRIWVVGATCSGKTTLAAELAAQLGCPHVELDGLYWQQNWTPADPDEFRARVADALAGDCWVVDGNYRGALGERVAARVQMVVWLDYPLPVNLWRLIKRGVSRVINQEALWEHGNRETWSGAFFSRDSLLMWLLRTHGERRTRYTTMMRQPTYMRVRFVRLRSPRTTQSWLYAFIS